MFFFKRTKKINELKWLNTQGIFQKKKYSKEMKLVFKYGNSDFAQVCKPGIFYVDRTNFIPLLENYGEILTFLRPRRFGKTMIISMLDYYYNILYKDRFEEIFGHLEIGKNPTSERNSYLIFRISFSSLETGCVASFKQSLSKRLNGVVRDFKNKYKSIFHDSIEEINIDETDGVESFSSLTDFVRRSEFRGKLYILIDEYDNSVNKALSDTKTELYESLYVKSNEAESLKKNIQKEQQSLFRRFFSTIKDKFSEGGVGRVFITGVSPIGLNDFTSGFNISEHITHEKEFQEMCGIYDFEIEKVVEKAYFIEKKDDKEKLIQLMKENYDGYMFSSTQTKKIYNTTLVVYFLKRLFNYEQIPDDLIDLNSQPSEYGLEIISKTELSQQIVDQLYQNGENGIYVEEKISKTIMTRNMMELLQTNQLYILSFLYYLGALTQSSLPKGKNIGTVFKIPNQVIKTLFIDNIQQRLSINKNVQTELKKAVNTLINERDISSLCDLIQEHILSHLKGNDVVHSLENSVKTSFLLGFNFSGRKINVMNEYKENDENEFTRSADIVLVQERIHIEIKKLKINNIILPDGTHYHEKDDWDIGVEYAKKIQNLNEDQLFKLKLNFIIMKGKKENSLNRNLETIGDYWENLLEQTKINHQWVAKKIGKEVDSFVVLRIGLYQLKYKKIEL